MFSTDYQDILQQVDRIDPIQYGKTRNYLNGAVTRLSPYISRGVLSTRFVASQILKRGFHPGEVESLLRELAWRDYFQQVWIALGDRIHEDVRQVQEKVSHRQMPEDILQANTGIRALDEGIRELYDTGYIHNHLRMYLASLACNISKGHWLQPARWMYYHLLDADWASNALSWQWVAGSFSSKKYFANQENINKYCGSEQKHTFLDVPYDAFESMQIPELLRTTRSPELKTGLPESEALFPDDKLPLYVYNFYNIDCNWDAHISANRILLLEPSFFELYPVCSRTLEFTISLARNIPGIRIIVGNFEEIFKERHHGNIHFKEHPSNRHYRGTEHPREWMFPDVKGYFPSFFAYWKKCEPHLNQLGVRAV